MTPAQRHIVETLQSRFGPKTAVTDEGDIAPWLVDWRGRYHGQSPAILAPGSTEEVVAAVGLCLQHEVPLVPQGGNTSMVGGATPPSDGSALILSLRRMNAIRSIDDHRAVAEAGVVLADLHGKAASIGRRFTLNLGARGSATIGGLIATNAGGTQVLRFGTMRSHVLGLEAVLPDGSLHEGLVGLKKDNRGYSLDQLLIGSEGTIGIVTAAALRLAPAALARAVAWVGLDSPADALGLLRFMQDRSEHVEGFEIVPDISLQLVLRHIPGSRPPLAKRHGWHVLIEMVATRAGERPVMLLEAMLASAMDRKLIADAVVSQSEAQAEAFWRIRDSISEAERAEGPTLAHDVSVPVDDMPRFMTDASAAVEQAFPGVSASGFGHLGDGNVHFHVRGGTRAAKAWDKDEADRIGRFVHDLVVAAGGSISAEHGIGQMKRAELERLGPSARVGSLRAIKRGLDPSGLFNPGKLVP